MQLLLLTPSLGSGGGGIGAFAAALEKALHEGGHAVHPIVLPHTPRWWQRALFPLRALAAALRKRPQRTVVTHLHLAPVALLLRLLLGIPYLVVLHGIEVRPDLSALRLRALREAARLASVSRHTAARLRALPGFAATPVALLPNTYDADRFRPQDCRDARALVAWRAQLGLAPGERVLLSVTRLDPREAYKGVDRVLTALPAVTAAAGPLRYLVAGEGADRPRLERLAAELGLKRVFQPLGFVADEDLPLLYRLADAFVLPSTGEGFGIVFLEAMASGTPVLAGNRDGSVDALADGELGLLGDPLDQASIEAGILRLLRRQGPSCWFERQALSEEVRRRFGPGVFSEIANKLFAET